MGKAATAPGLSGILLSSMDGARIENINFSNITVSGTKAPILLRLGDRGRARGGQKRKPAGSIRGIHFNGLRVRSGGSLGLEATAVPGHCIENLEFNDFSFEFVGGGPGEPEWAAPYPVPEVAPDEYPDPGLHGIPPSWGLFARRVRGLRLRHGSFALIAAEDRPPIIADDVTGLQLLDVRFPEGIQESVRHVPQGEERPKPVLHPSITPRLLARYKQET